MAAQLLALALLAAELPIPAEAADGWVKSYKRGVEAIDRKEWEEAVALLGQAVAVQPAASARSPRLLFRRYIPYYLLGVAWFELGNCNEALKALEESALQGVVAEMPEGYDLDRKRRHCLAQTDRTDALARARASIERATAASAAVAELQRNPELDSVWEWREDSLGKRQKRAEALLEDARAALSLDPERLTTAQLQEAGERAAQARWQLEAIRVEATQHLEEVRALLEAKRADLDKLLSEAQKQRAAVERLKPVPSGLALRLANLERAMSRARSAPAGASVDDLVEIETALGESIQALRSAGSQPPKVLVQAAEAYFSGDYGRSVELLTSARVSGSRAQAHLYLLRSAARYALYRLGGQAPELLSLAADDARACRRQSATLRPSATLFSPGFVEFFDLQAAIRLEP